MFTVPAFDLGHANLQNPLRSIGHALRLRPRRVVTTGAGVIFTFTFVSWLLGAQVVFLETMARVATPSRTGAALARLAKLHIVQWPELLDTFPHAKLCRPTLLPDHLEVRSSPGAGSFVSLGTHPAPFDRLLDLVEEAVATGALPTPVLVQGGRRRTSADTTFVDAMSPQTFADSVRRATIVVGHGGAGFISAALREGHRPIVVPRLADRGEHVDSHQLELTRKLSELGLVVNAEDGIDQAAVAAALQPLAYDDTFAGLPAATDLIKAHLSDSR